jgi:hypothetical protein
MRLTANIQLAAEPQVDPSLQAGGEGANSLQILWEDSERAFCRQVSHADAGRTAVLVVVPVAEHPSPASLDRLAHEFGLKDELDPAWAVRPLGLTRDGGRTMLVLEDPGGEPPGCSAHLWSWGTSCPSRSALPRL